MNYRKVVQSIVLIAALGLAGGAAQAELIPLNIPPAPDLGSGFITVSYDADSHLFLAQGYSNLYTADDTTAYNFLQEDGLFSISAYISNDGVLLSPGTFSMSGTLVLPSGTVGSSTDGSLLTGNITQFGFDPVPDGVLQFVFNATGGDLASVFGQGAITLSQIGAPTLDSPYGFTGSFSESFGPDPNAFFGPAVADIGVTPEPGTFLLFVSGAGLLLLRRRRSHSA